MYKNNTKMQPDDPTSNNNNQMAGTTGLTGITQDPANANLSQYDGDALTTASIDRRRRNNDIAEEADTNYKEPKAMSAKYDHPQPTQSIGDDGNNKKYVGQTPPSVQGETSDSGDMPDPDADDDTLANAQYMGMQPNETPEKPQEVDIARDVDNAEEYVRSH